MPVDKVCKDFISCVVFETPNHKEHLLSRIGLICSSETEKQISANDCCINGFISISWVCLCEYIVRFPNNSINRRSRYILHNGQSQCLIFYNSFFRSFRRTFLRICFCFIRSVKGIHNGLLVGLTIPDTLLTVPAVLVGLQSIPDFLGRLAVECDFQRAVLLIGPDGVTMLAAVFLCCGSRTCIFTCNFSNFTYNFR